MSKAFGQGESFEGIQYLRALAAIMVVGHHATAFFGGVSGWSNFGMTGVDIFFVISGFIMVHATYGLDPNGNRAQQAADFFVRRLIRVVPLYWLALAYMNRADIRRGDLGCFRTLRSSRASVRRSPARFTRHWFLGGR
ncbi:MAG: hypothetical protein DI587_38015 [Variovorax paradoxus]|nr:MAG: hypothetical protein DI583_38015 [Variovorax paradoxus]PZP99819.1 MAG: hypothetical protein DI587_38015 [Variovorax paradoxus]